MNKDLHDIDELFRSQLESYQEKPSAALKESLDAALDKKETEKYKRRFIIWKRAALLLLLLLAGFLLYESGLIKKDGGNYTEKKSATETDRTSGEKTVTVYPDKNIPADENVNNIVVTSQPPVQNDMKPGSQNQTGINSSPEVSFITGNGSIVRKSNSLLSATSSPPDKKENSLTLPDDYRLTNMPGIQALDKRISNDLMIERLTKNIILLPPTVISKAAPLIAADNNPGKKKSNPFKPFWLISPFVSYDQAGYRLDSDDPVIISNIKHNEVHEPSFSGGVLATRQFTEHWGLQTGLVYSYTAIGISPQKIYAFQDPAGDIAYKYITSSGYAYIKPAFGPAPAFGDSLTVESKHQIKTLNIPLSVRYSIRKNKLTITPGAGVEAGFVTSAKAEVELTDASNHERAFINKLSGTKKFYWSATAAVELQYKLTGKTSITLQPVYRHALSPITENNVVETFPRSFGVRAGLTFRF